MSASERIRQRMKELNISQNALARAAGMSQSGLSTILSGKARPREDSLEAIAKALGCTVPDLLGADEDAEAEEDEIMALREELRRSPDMRMLFSAASKATPEHIRAAAAMLKALEPGEDFTE